MTPRALIHKGIVSALIVPSLRPTQSPTRSLSRLTEPLCRFPFESPTPSGALRAVLASQPQHALVALLYALIRRFQETEASCIEIVATVADLTKSSQTVGESKAAAVILERRDRWGERLPDRQNLWDWLVSLDVTDRLELLAFCTAMSIDAVHRPWREGVRQAEADVLARALCLDMAEWWKPTRSGFFAHLLCVRHEIRSVV